MTDSPSGWANLASRKTVLMLDSRVDNVPFDRATEAAAHRYRVRLESCGKIFLGIGMHHPTAAAAIVSQMGLESADPSRKSKREDCKYADLTCRRTTCVHQHGSALFVQI